MPAKIYLQNIVDGMDMQSDEVHMFLDITTGEVVHVAQETLDDIEAEDPSAEGDSADGGEAAPPNPLRPQPDWYLDELKLTRGVVANEGARYLALPDRFDIHEYNIMESFANSLGNTDAADRLLSALRGSGAFRRFKNTLYYLGIEKQWFDYKREAFEEIAIAWCEDHNLEFTRDRPPFDPPN